MKDNEETGWKGGVKFIQEFSVAKRKSLGVK